MNFQNSCVIPAPAQKLWAFLTAIPSVATCMPGVEEVNDLGDGKYVGVVILKVGVVKLRLAGKIATEVMDSESRVASMRVEANDQRISGMIMGLMTMKLEELGANETKLVVDTDLSLFGKIGEFGQPMIKKKADQLMTEFAGNLAERMGGSASSSGRKARAGSIYNLSGDFPQ